VRNEKATNFHSTELFERFAKSSFYFPFDKELLKKLKNINNEQKTEAELARNARNTTLSHTRTTTRSSSNFLFCVKRRKLPTNAEVHGDFRSILPTKPTEIISVDLLDHSVKRPTSCFRYPACLFEILWSQQRLSYAV
jgi:hypothetical protein